VKTKQSNSRETDKLWHKGIEFVVRRARSLTRESQITTPPFLPEYLAYLRGIRVTKQDLGSLSGLLVPLREGYEIKLNAKHPTERQNYSCAHEIAHTFFQDDEGTALIEQFSDGNGRKDKWEERLCDIAAAELLMPKTIFGQYASSCDFSILSLQKLAYVFNTSIRATATRLGSISPRPCFVGFSTLEFEGSNEETNRSSSFSFDMKISSGGGRFCISRKVNSKNSSLLKAYKSDSPIYSQERMKLPSFVGLCRIESQGFGHEPYRYVVSLIFPECQGSSLYS
jgi:hypothetical protein